MSYQTLLSTPLSLYSIPVVWFIALYPATVNVSVTERVRSLNKCDFPLTGHIARRSHRVRQVRMHPSLSISVLVDCDIVALIHGGTSLDLKRKRDMVRYLLEQVGSMRPIRYVLFSD
jgi:hypothetical protein